MRWADAHAMDALGISGKQLMAAAGDRVAETMMRLVPAGVVCIACGPGNNGGDGLAAASRLHKMGREVQVLLAVPAGSMHGNAADFLAQAQADGVRVLEVETAAVNDVQHLLDGSAGVVDALFGTGLSRHLESEAAELVAMINDADVPVLAVDITSGIHSDTGEALGEPIRATWTLPIAACKWGHWIGDGAEHAGEILCAADIGIPIEVIREAFEEVPSDYRSAQMIPEDMPSRVWMPRLRDAHKGVFGHVWIFGGSIGFAGAPRLAARGAFAAGAGLVSIACPESVWPLIAATEIDAMVHPDDAAPWQKADALVIGPGWGVSRDSLFGELLGEDCPLVIDADALNLLASNEALSEGVASRRGITVLTPHPGEAGRLLGMPTVAVQHDRKQVAVDLARCFRAWVVLKGAGTLVASPEGDLHLCRFGSANLAVAGSGDVLAGMVGAVLARGCEPTEGISAAVVLHAFAGESSDWFLASGLAGKVASIRRNMEQYG